MIDNAWIDKLKTARVEVNINNGVSHPINFPDHEEALVIIHFEGAGYLIERGLLRLFVERGMLAQANALEAVS